MTIGSFDTPDPPYPPGVIKVWTGAVTDIPDGWVFCDGNNGTPDLRGKHPKGVPDTSTDPGSTGGTNSYTMSTAQLPNHTHSATSKAQSNGAHKHGVSRDSGDDGTSGEDVSGSSTDTFTTTSDGSHSHNVKLASSGGSSSIDNQPAHTDLAFIQKL